MTFDILGHRGARGLFPENTLEGFLAAHAAGVSQFELDVVLTADGVVVVSHDLCLNPDITRLPDGRWITPPGPPISALSWSSLAGFDLGRIRPGSAYAAAHPRQHPVDGARIPTLQAVLRLLPDTSLLIELKTDPTVPCHSADPVTLADSVLAVVNAVGASKRVTIESFDWRGLHHVRRCDPLQRLGWLTRAETVAQADLWWNGVDPAHHDGSVPHAVAAQGGGIWAVAYQDLTPEAVIEAHALGLTVLPWTVNDPADMQRLRALGVDGLITDRPDLAIACVGRNDAEQGDAK